MSPRWRFWGICLHAAYPIVDWSMMRDFCPGPMALFHGAENNTRGCTVCCLEPSSSLPSGTTHMQVNNMELGSVSKKKASSEPAHRNRTDRFVQRSGIFGRQMMEELQPREAHIVSADAPVIHGQKSILRQIRFCRYCVLRRMELPLCIGLRNPKRQEYQASTFT